MASCRRRSPRSSGATASGRRRHGSPRRQPLSPWPPDALWRPRSAASRPRTRTPPPSDARWRRWRAWWRRERRGRRVSQGLFELRKDAITGWWVATVVDRTFARERFALPSAAIDDRGDCFNCRIPSGDGIRLRVLKDFAFTVAGTEEEARQRDATVAQVTIDGARAAGSWRTVVAPPREHRPLHSVGSDVIEGLLRRARDESATSRGADPAGSPPRLRRSAPRAGRRTGPPTCRLSRTGVPRGGRAPTASASTCTTCRR